MTLDSATVKLIVAAILAIEPAVANLVTLIIKKIEGAEISEDEVKAAMEAAANGLDEAMAKMDADHNAALIEATAELSKAE